MIRIRMSSGAPMLLSTPNGDNYCAIALLHHVFVGREAERGALGGSLNVWHVIEFIRCWRPLSWQQTQEGLDKLRPDDNNIHLPWRSSSSAAIDKSINFAWGT